LAERKRKGIGLKDYKRAAQHSSQGIHVLGNKAGSQFGDVLGKKVENELHASVGKQQQERRPRNS